MDMPSFGEHELVVTRHGPRSGLRLTVAVHSRARGPAIGGARLWHYERDGDGVADALRLSAAMTLKCAVAGVAYGGGKSVVEAPRELPAERRRAALLDLGDLVAELDGDYRVGPDIGTGPVDMIVIRERTPHVFCLPVEHGGAGSSSGPTAAGVLATLRAGARHAFGTSELRGRTAVVIGLGSVGLLVARALVAMGARVAAADVDPARRAAGLGRLPVDEAARADTDILVPAAVGGLLTAAVVDDLRARLVVGPANNQLADDGVADLLHERGITWVPDVLASAGGIVATLAREVDGVDTAEAERRVAALGDIADRVLRASRRSGRTPLREVVNLARIATG